MLEQFVRLLAPHYCCSCDKIGSILCDYCKYDITSDPFQSCLVCNTACAGGEALCGRHVLPYSRAWCVGERSETLKQLMNAHKFERARAGHEIMAELLDHVLPQLPSDTTIVPVPTIAKHIRQRGYDHTTLLAKQLACHRSLPYSHILERATSTSQLGKGRKERRLQASQAFQSATTTGRILLIDDIFTTGSTLEYAAKALKEAGASEVWTAVIARQPLEK